MIQFYSAEIETNPILPESESVHCCRVLRMRKGDEIFVTDGKGRRFRCEILEADPRHTSVRIIEKEKFEPDKDYRLTLAVAPTKSADRMEWMVEKAVELGVDKIVLLRCSRSERKIMKAERLNKVIVSAMKQSLGTFLPELVELTDIKAFVDKCGKKEQKFFGYCSDELPKKELAKEYVPGRDTIILIGPEGDFTDDEVEFCMSRGFEPVTFGKKRLRTETAGVFAVCAVSTLNQRLK